MKKQIPNSNYFVDTDGNIYGKSKKLKTNQVHGGYSSVLISYHNKEKKRWLVHRLVAELFVPNPENKPLVNHIDGNKQNNKVENLEWVTYKENNNHARRLGLYSDEEGTLFSAVFTREQIIRVCEMLAEGRRDVDITEATGVSKSGVQNVRSRKQWTHISKDYEFSSKSRRRKISDDTIHWICQMIKQGLTKAEICDKCEKITRQDLYKIENKEIYTDISKDYF